MSEKFSDTKLLNLIDVKGLSVPEAARKLGVTRQAVHYRLKNARGNTVAALASVSATEKLEKFVDSRIDVVQQLVEINRKALSLLDKAEGDDDRNTSLKAMAEVRNQLRLLMDIHETMFSHEGVREFTQSVLEVLDEADPVLRQQVIAKLNNKSALRQALRFAG